MILNRSDEKKLQIPPSLLELAGLAYEPALELHSGEGVIVMLPARMSATDVISAITMINGLAVDLLYQLGQACGECDDCSLCNEEILNRTARVPEPVLEAAGLPSGCKLAAYVDEYGDIIVEEAEYTHDLTDVPAFIINAFVHSRCCLTELERLLMEEEVVYDAVKSPPIPVDFSQGRENPDWGDNIPAADDPGGTTPDIWPEQE